MYAMVALRTGNLHAATMAHGLQDFPMFLPIMTKYLHGLR
jgi:hypothetical protein